MNSEIAVNASLPGTPPNVPVLLIVFNRPDFTRAAFEAIRAAKPPRLYVAADGAREGRPDELARCAEVRQIVQQVDWPCETHYLFRERNVGCKLGVSSAIDWLFENEDRGIIIEDDCIVSPEFFTFCEEMLELYEHNENIFSVTGGNYSGNTPIAGRYYFSRYFHSWGWATWRRAWKHYNGDIPNWAARKQTPEWLSLFPDDVERAYWEEHFDRFLEGAFDSWDYPLMASIWEYRALTITPAANLVGNIGIGPDATHTKTRRRKKPAPFSKLPPSEAEPIPVAQHIEADRYTFNHRFGGKLRRWPHSAIWSLRMKAEKILGGMVSLFRKTSNA